MENEKEKESKIEMMKKKREEDKRSPKKRKEDFFCAFFLFTIDDLLELAENKGKFSFELADEVLGIEYLIMEKLSETVVTKDDFDDLISPRLRKLKRMIDKDFLIERKKFLLNDAV